MRPGTDTGAMCPSPIRGTRSELSRREAPDQREDGGVAEREVLGPARPATGGAARLERLVPSRRVGRAKTGALEHLRKQIPSGRPSVRDQDHARRFWRQSPQFSLLPAWEPPLVTETDRTCN